MPEIGALTTWGDADFDEELEARSPLDAEPELYIPEPDNDGRIAWLPVPEDEPRSDVAFHVPAFFEQVEPEAETSPEWNRSVCYHVVDSMDCESALAGFGQHIRDRRTYGSHPEQASGHQPAERGNTGG